MQAVDIKNRMDAMAAYLDQLYTTIEFKGKTCGLLASYPGFPLWIDVNRSLAGGVWVGSTRDSYKGLFLYRDGDWAQKDSGMTTAAKEGVRDIGVCPHDPRIIICTTADGVWRTTDEGENWSQVTMPDTRQYHSLAWDTESPGIVLVTCQDLKENNSQPRVARSTNYGASFSLIALPRNSGLIENYQTRDTGAVAFHDGRAIVACRYGNTPNFTWGQFWVSEDAGANFAQLWLDSGDNDERLSAWLGVRNKFMELNGPNNSQYAREEQATTTNLTNWTYKSGGVPPGRTGDYGNQLVFDAKRNRFWHPVGNKLYFTDDFGENWDHFEASGCTLYSLAVDQDSGALYLSMSGANDAASGTFISTDGGEGWHKLGTDPYVGRAIAPAYSDWPGARGVGKRALGQYFGKDVGAINVPHSVISGQGNAPGWVTSGAYGAASDEFVFGLEDGDGQDYLAPPGKAKRSYTQTDVTYRIENIAEDYSTPNLVDVYVGGIKAVANLKSKSPDNWYYEVTKSNDFFRSLDYPPRHGFHLGRMVYAARGEATKAGELKDSADESGIEKDIYDVFYGDWAMDYDPYYIFDRKQAYPETEMALHGDRTVGLPQGIAADGGYIYAHESRVAVGDRMALGARWLVAHSFLLATQWATYTRLLWALHMLRKYGKPSQKYHDPRLGWLPVTIQTLSVLDVAEEAVAKWEQTGGLGLPPASDAMVAVTDKASGFTTAIFTAFMSVLGYGCGYNRYKEYADAGAEQLCSAVWGCSPNADGKGWIDGTEYTRPNHKGGLLVAWKEGNSLHLPETSWMDKLLDGVFYDFRFPLYTTWGWRIEIGPLSPQKAQESNPIPTNMEATALAWMALRIHLAYKYGEAYPSGTWENGLNLLSGWVSGKVIDEYSSPITGASVIVVDGQQTVNPQDLTVYRRRVTTGEDGSYALPFEGAGERTLYVVKEGYKHLYKTHSFAADQNVVFPDAVLMV